MKKLSKKDEAQLDELHQKVVDAAVALNAARSEFEQFREEKVAEMESFFEERSERWQESEKGEAYRQWITEWEREVLDEVDEAPEEYPTEPDL